MEYQFRNVNESFAVMWHRMLTNDGVIQRPSRNGPMRESTTPVTLTYTMPRERVLLLDARDANPFFHLFEAIWMLAGRSEVAWLAQFAKRMLNYSDDGKTLVSDYGRRWREVLPEVVDKIRKDGNTRRAYIPIFRPQDCELNGADLPCNVGIALYPRGKHLDMTVFNRSNDMIWGSLGANYVHFSFFQEYVAALCNLEVGWYSQISSCFHVYPDFDVCKRLHGNVPPVFDPYDGGMVRRSNTRVLSSTSEERWQQDAHCFIDELAIEGSACWEQYARNHEWNEPFFHNVAVPMFCAWKTWTTSKDFERAMAWANMISDADDWQTGSVLWLRRRHRNAMLSAMGRVNGP